MPRITWLSTIQQDLRFYNLALPESASLSHRNGYGPEAVSVEVVDVWCYYWFCVVRASARVVWRCLPDNLPFLTMLVAIFDFDHRHGASLLYITSAPSLLVFRRKLKTHLFRQS